MISKVWVEDAWFSTSVRADEILAVRVTMHRPESGPPIETDLHDQPGPCWQLDLVTRGSLGHQGSNVVPLLHARLNTFPQEGPRRLEQLIARHIDDPVGGVIVAANEDDAEWLAGWTESNDRSADPLDHMLVFKSFNEHPPERLEPMRTPSPVERKGHERKGYEQRVTPPIRRQRGSESGSSVAEKFT